MDAEDKKSVEKKYNSTKIIKTKKKDINNMSCGVINKSKQQSNLLNLGKNIKKKQSKKDLTKKFLIKKNEKIKKHNMYLKENTEQLHKTAKELINTLKNKKLISSKGNTGLKKTTSNLNESLYKFEEKNNKINFLKKKQQFQNKLLQQNKKLTYTLQDYKKYLESKISKK